MDMKTYLVVRQKVRDYAQWKREFDSCHDNFSRDYGFKGTWISRNADDANEIIVTVACTDLERAREFVASKDLKDAMKRAGVADKPSFWFLEEIAEVPELVGAGVSSTSDSASIGNDDDYYNTEGD
jgi:hypothetical protein